MTNNITKHKLPATTPNFHHPTIPDTPFSQKSASGYTCRIRFVKFRFHHHLLFGTRQLQVHLQNRSARSARRGEERWIDWHQHILNVSTLDVECRRKNDEKTNGFAGWCVNRSQNFSTSPRLGRGTTNESWEKMKTTIDDNHHVHQHRTVNQNHQKYQ